MRLYKWNQWTVDFYECDCKFVHYYLHFYEELRFDSDLLNSWIFPVEIEAGGFEFKKIKAGNL